MGLSGVQPNWLKWARMSLETGYWAMLGSEFGSGYDKYGAKSPENLRQRAQKKAIRVCIRCLSVDRAGLGALTVT